MNRPTWMALTTLIALAGPASGVPEGADYSREIKPLLRERCYACHGALKQAAGLRLDTGAAARLGGDSGPAVEPGAPDESPIIDRVTDPDLALRMPPEGPPLTAEQVEALRSWIASGAPSPEGERPEPDPREHWAFRVPVRPALPAVSDPEWGLNPIDAFVAAGRDARGLGHRPEADRAALLRRVSIDLVGLPPTRDELRAFLADESPDAYEKTVERLLNSPRHGERWGRHFMDVWRYSDWYGRRMVPDVWNSAPQIWRWRDWIVRSFNEDKGYDRMVAEMLAGDEVAPADEETAVATGYLVRNWYALNPNQWMRDNVEHTAKAFLALTFNCAHCHDHKYDPIKQTDYFGLRAFFEPIGVRQDRWKDGPDPGPFQEYEYSVLRKIARTGAVRVYDKTPDAPTWFYTGGDERNRLTDQGPVSPGVPAFLASGFPKVAPLALPVESTDPGLRPAVIAAERSRLREELAAAELALARARDEADASLGALSAARAKAEAGFNVAAETFEKAGGRVALAGRQSLFVDASTGRRALNNPLAGLGTLPDGSTLSFLLQVRSEGHVNIQLARDVIKGETAGVVVFEKGAIRSYRPGGTEEFEAGRYDAKAGETFFRVAFAFGPDAGTARLTVESLNDGKTLADSVPVARNGWSPAGDPKQALTVDARAGSIVDVDEIKVTSPGQTVVIDFEAPLYAFGSDVVGVQGWSASPFARAPATSIVSATSTDPTVRSAADRLEGASRSIEAVGLGLKAAEARLAAARSAPEAAEARLAADMAKRGGPTDAFMSLAEAAGRLERLAARDAAEADLMAAKRATTGTDRKKAVAALAEAQAALDKAVAALASPPKSPPYTPFGPSYPATSTGRRKALADWITSPENPLAARVAVNHVWMRHFHAPLVGTVFDFGRNGAPPTHPELIDWLAVELRESGWSLKHLHRLIVTSRTYRMSSARGDALADASADPENAFLWRMNAGRMEAEAVRDGLLHVAGALQSAMGGQELENEQSLTTRRRSLYYACHPESGGKSEFGALFDAPDAFECYRRARSVVPQQALALTNNPLVHELSRSLAASVWRVSSASSPAAFVDAVYEHVLSRPPSTAELDLCLGFLGRTEGAAAEAKAREGLVRAVFNHNDFLTIR